MKSPVFSELIRLKSLCNSLPEETRGRFLSVLKIKTAAIRSDFSKWEVQLENCLSFHGVEINHSNLIRWKSKLFPRDPHQSALLMIRATRISIKQKE